MNLDQYIRRVPDFPKKGIVFYDITSILAQPEVFHWVIEQMVDLYRDIKIDAVVGIESRGFIFATAFALRCKLPQILVRKAGKLPGATLKKSYQLEYGEDEIEVHKADIPQGRRVLLVDDLIATGQTLRASYQLLGEAGALVEHAFGVIGLPFLKFAETVPRLKIQTLINYNSE